MKVADVISFEVARREQARAQLVDAIVELFDIAPGTRTYCKRSEACDAIATKLVRVQNNDLRRQVRDAMKSLGVVCTSSGGYALFRGARLKGTEGKNPHTEMSKRKKEA